MKTIEAIWEKENIGSNVIEINIEKDDTPNDFDFGKIPLMYDYIVVKVPANMTEFNWVLGKCGFSFVETQIKLSKNYNEINFNDRSIKRFLPFMSSQIINKENELSIILDRITPDMFVTDRITLDPQYGPEIGCKRYKNYIRNSFYNQTAEIIGVYFKKMLIGFGMHSIKNGACYGKLGGVFADVKIPGMGFAMPFTIMKFCKDIYDVDVFYPDISSNNISQVSIYEKQHFHVDELAYVFVKHQ